MSSINSKQSRKTKLYNQLLEKIDKMFHGTEPKMMLSCIYGQMLYMVDSHMSFKILNQIGLENEKIGGDFLTKNPRYSELLIMGYLSTQMISIRRLTDTDENVTSLYRVVKLLENSKHLIPPEKLSEGYFQSMFAQLEKTEIKEIRTHVDKVIAHTDQNSHNMCIPERLLEKIEICHKIFFDVMRIIKVDFFSRDMALPYDLTLETDFTKFLFPLTNNNVMDSVVAQMQEWEKKYIESLSR